MGRRLQENANNDYGNRYSDIINKITNLNEDIKRLDGKTPAGKRQCYQQF